MACVRAQDGGQRRGIARTRRNGHARPPRIDLAGQRGEHACRILVRQHSHHRQRAPGHRLVAQGGGQRPCRFRVVRHVENDLRRMGDTLKSPRCPRHSKPLAYRRFAHRQTGAQGLQYRQRTGCIA